MNDGLFNGFGSNAPGYMRRAVWEVYETTVANVPFRTDARFVSFLIVGGGGGGGGGRFGLSTAAAGGGGGASGCVIVLRRMNVQVCTQFGLQFIDYTIGAGGTGGSGGATDATNGGAGTSGGSTTVNFKVKHPSQDSTQYILFDSTAPQGSGGNGGTTAQATGGLRNTSPLAGFEGTNGSNSGDTGFANYAYTATGATAIPASNGPGGGNGGMAKNARAETGIHFGNMFGRIVTPITGRGTIGQDGVHSEVLTNIVHQQLFMLPYSPDVLEFRNYMSVGGGAGMGGDTTANTRGGDGGNGYRGSGGGGGGGASGVRGGNGGSGGKGCVFVCWEFQ